MVAARRPGLLVAVLAVALLLLALPPVRAQDATAAARAQAAAWLVGEYERGTVQGFGGLADLIVALVAADVDDARIATVVDAARQELERVVLEGQDDAGQPSVGEVAKSALGITVGGGDPEDVEGTSLVTVLRNRIVRTGADQGRIGDAGPFVQALAIFVLAATEQGVPVDAMTWLAQQACSDGGFNFVIAEDEQGVSQGCDPAAEGEADTTALVVQALLGTTEVAPQRQGALQWLLDRQSADGSVDGNANSTGLSGQTFLAAGEVAAAADARDFLLTLQYGSQSQRPGAIRFTPEQDGSLLLATTQGILGLDAPSFAALLDRGTTPEPPPGPTPSPDPTAPPGPDAGIERVGGDTRIATAIAASRAGFDADTAGGVVLARADAFADALAGTPLAAARGGPLLITDPDALDGDVAAELLRVLPDDGAVTLLGGPLALGQQVADDVDALGFTTTRIAGDTRVTTAIAVAGALGNPTTALITTGADFPDALTAGAAAAFTGNAAVLLTTGDRPSGALDEYLMRTEPATVVAIGGPAARAYPDAVSLAGTSREGTAIAVAERFFLTPPAIAVARRDGFADALAGGVLAAQQDAPLLLTDPARLGEVTARFVCSTPTVAGALLLGGETAVSSEVGVQIAGLIAGRGCPPSR